MTKHLKTAAALALVLSCAALPLMAQGKSGVSTVDMDAALSTKPAVSRAGLQAFLATGDAQQAAKRLGVSSENLSARVATLDQSTLNAFAQQAKVDDRILAGGRDSVVISTTAIIIILLLLILLTK